MELIELNTQTTVLVIADSNFINLCENPHEYIQKLKTRVAEVRTDNAVLFTVSGRYGLSGIDQSIPILEVNDRNKTLFGQTLENSSMFFDEVMAISLVESDPYILSAREMVTAAGKTFTHYKYPRKDDKAHGRKQESL